MLERYDESMVYLAHRLRFSLADMVVVQNKRVFTKHPSAWPETSMLMLRDKMRDNGEAAVYAAANEALSKGISQVAFDFSARLSQYRNLGATIKQVQKYQLPNLLILYLFLF